MLRKKSLEEAYVQHWISYNRYDVTDIKIMFDNKTFLHANKALTVSKIRFKIQKTILTHDFCSNMHK